MHGTNTTTRFLSRVHINDRETLISKYKTMHHLKRISMQEYNTFNVLVTHFF